VTKVVNLAGAPLGPEHERAGWRRRSLRVGDELGAAMIGGSVYELPAGERTFPFHYHHGVEEWLLVLDGTPSLRTPSGTRELKAGDVVCFPPGADGAHTVTGPGRVLILSQGSRPSISVYPDSDKLGTRSGEESDTRDFRRADAVDYWDGEE
jgi:uncharacterized cupin superfamily protein